MCQPIDNYVRNMRSDDNVVSAVKDSDSSLHAPARKNFPRRRIIVRRYDNLWQADIIVRCVRTHVQQRLPLHTYHHRCVEQARVGRIV